MTSKIILKIIQGELKGKQFIFDSRDTCVIGRDPSCNIQIPNDQAHSFISRRHCFLDINPPEIRICDAGSRNGTLVNGKCIGKRRQNQTPSEGAKLNLLEYPLRHGDLIALGNTVFKVSIETTEDIPSTFIIEKELSKIPPQIKLKTDGHLGELNDYIKVQKLGEGGFGSVYLARTPETDELVAIKTLFPQVALQPYMKERFLREARNTKILNHPNLVQFKDYGFDHNMFYFVMEYCERGSVTDLIEVRKGKLIIKEATNIILQILDGLHHAHTEHRLVHRDIKPSNIFLTVDKARLVAKLGDYGLTKSFDLAGLSGLTRTGAKMGTPNFMPRQQVLDFKYAQPDVDVWAVAASLYYMLTLQYPRDLNDIEQHPMFAILETQPVPIRERDASIPQALAELIDLALKDDSKLHFKTALAFKNALLTVI